MRRVSPFQSPGRDVGFLIRGFGDAQVSIAGQSPSASRWMNSPRSLRLDLQR